MGVDWATATAMAGAVGTVEGLCATMARARLVQLPVAHRGSLAVRMARCQSVEMVLICPDELVLDATLVR